MNIEINVEQSPLTITPTNAEHIYTLSSTGHTLPGFKYIVDVYFRPQGLDEELASRLKVAPNSYGKAIMDVGEIIRTFLNANPRFEAELEVDLYPYLNNVADENSIITLSSANKTRDYNAYNLTNSGNVNRFLPILWHVAQYRCVVGCEYISGNTIITDVNPDASFQPDYITIFPGVDNTLIPQPDLPYATLGNDYLGSSNFFQMNNQGWYYYDLFRHVYQKPGTKECDAYYYKNGRDKVAVLTYISCDDGLTQILNIFPGNDESFCAEKGSVSESPLDICLKYLVINNGNDIPINSIDCDGTPNSMIVLEGEAIELCAVQNSITSDNPSQLQIIPLQLCDICQDCTKYSLYNSNATQTTTVDYNDCYNIAKGITLGPSETLEICACPGTIRPESNETIITDLGECGGDDRCVCLEYEVLNGSPAFVRRFEYVNCNGIVVSPVLAPNETTKVCACEGTVSGDDMIITQIGDCDDCSCISYQATNTSVFGVDATVNWLDCDRIYRSAFLSPDSAVLFCACEGSVTFTGVVQLDNLGECGDNRIIDEGLCSGYNPVKECPGPQEFMNAAGKTECAVVEADGKSFTNVRRRMHHPDCPMIVSFLNGKNDYFTNDIYSIAIRGALNHGDPYTYSAETENRTTINLPTNEEPPNSTFKMLNFYLPYNVTSGDVLNAIPTDAQKVCFYGTSYNANTDNRLNMASATTEILEYWIQPKDCINEPIHILFMNGRGMWDTYTFGKKNTKKITLERKKYQQESSLDKSLYSRGSSNRGQKIYEQNADYSWDCNTWFMDEADTKIMEELFMSQDVFIITGTTIQNQQCPSEDDAIRLYQYLIPVVIKETDFVVYQKQYQKIYQYNLTLEFGSVKRFRTQG